MKSKTGLVSLFCPLPGVKSKTGLVSLFCPLPGVKTETELISLLYLLPGVKSKTGLISLFYPLPDMKTGTSKQLGVLLPVKTGVKPGVNRVVVSVARHEDWNKRISHYRP